MTEISIAMIVKDEEQYISECLESVKELVAEIVIVDTGSKDKTIEIAGKFDAKIFTFEWNDDFSAARNFSISKCTKDWILVLDADEFLTEKGCQKIKEAIETQDYEAIRLIQHNYVKEADHAGFKPLDQEDPRNGQFVGWFPNPIIRVFRNDKDIYYEGKVHELVDEPLKKKQASILDSDIPIYHYGFVKEKKQTKEKYEKYEKISEDLDKIGGRELYIKGVSHHKNGDDSGAIEYLEQAKKAMPDNVQVAYVLGSLYLNEKEMDKAIDIMEFAAKIKKEDATTLDNDNPYSDLYSNLGAAYLRKGNMDKAFDTLKKSLEFGEKPNTLNNLAAVCMSKGKGQDAIKYICQALKIAPKDIALTANFASILAQVGKKKHAIMVYNELIKLDPDNHYKWQEKINALYRYQDTSFSLG